MIKAERLRKTRMRCKGKSSPDKCWIDDLDEVRAARKRLRDFHANPEVIFGDNWKMYCWPLEHLRRSDPELAGQLDALGVTGHVTDWFITHYPKQVMQNAADRSA